jgi:hypothetical protein
MGQRELATDREGLLLRGVHAPDIGQPWRRSSCLLGAGSFSLRCFRSPKPGQHHHPILAQSGQRPRFPAISWRRPNDSFIHTWTIEITIAMALQTITGRAEIRSP